jgi:hypothetical protein
MIPAILGSIFTSGLRDLGNALLDSGKEKLVESIKDKTGLDLNAKKELSNDDIKKLKEFEHKELELHYKDVQDARNKHLQLMNSDAPFIVKINRTIMSWIIVLGFLGIIIVFSMFELKIGESIQVMIISTFSTLLGMIYQSLFGGQANLDDLHRSIKK